MYWIDLAGVGLLGVFVGVGALRGFVAGILGMLALLGAYALAYLAATGLGPALALRLDLGPLLAGITAGVAAFVGGYVLLGTLAGIWLRRRRSRQERISRGDRIGGALLGGLQGTLIAVLLYWLVGQAQAGGLIGDARGPSPLVRASQEVVHRGAEAVLGGEGSSPLAARAVSDPVGMATELETLLEAPGMAALQQDALFWQYVSTGAIDSALNRASFMRIASDAGLRGRLADLGLVPEDARNDPRAFRGSAREALLQVAPRLVALRSDPALPELAADPEIRAAMEAGDLLGLASDPRIRELVRRTLAASPPPASAE